MSGKRGRPPEDRLARQREIYERVAPLVLDLGPRGLTMREAARAACLSLGGLHHYFPTKRALVLHGLEPEAFGRMCADFRSEAGSVAESDPSAYLAAFVDYSVSQISFVRPALHAALELGTDTFWDALESGINAGLDGFATFLRHIVPSAEEREIRRLARQFRGSFFAALLDRTMSADETRAALWELLEAAPLRLEPPAADASAQLAAGAALHRQARRDGASAALPSGAT